MTYTTTRDGRYAVDRCDRCGWELVYIADRPTPPQRAAKWGHQCPEGEK